MGYIGTAPGQKDIAAYTNIGAAPAETDELLISDAGVLKAITVDKLLDPAGYTNIGAEPAGSDEVLLSDAGVLKAVTVTNLIAGAGGGITVASQWRVTTDFTGAVDPIASNWEEADAPLGFGVLGSSMTESSGIFTFPSTGYYWIQAHGEFLYNGATQYQYMAIRTTTDNSTYASPTNPGQGSSTDASDYFQCDSSYIFDVVSTSNCKAAFKIGVDATGVTTKGDTNTNETHVTFIRLGDT